LIKKEAMDEYTLVPPNIYCEILFAEAVKVFIVLSDNTHINLERCRNGEGEVGEGVENGKMRRKKRKRLVNIGNKNMVCPRQ
jgi:hypothetical protein